MTDTHFCRWCGCQERIPTRLFACASHWAALPWPVRREILNAKPGTPEHQAAVRAALEWIKERRAVSPLRKERV